jgi:uncharacterized membrane protein
MSERARRRELWTPIAYALLVGLVGAGIVHIVILLLVPSFSGRDAWARLAATSDLYQVTRLDAEGAGRPVAGIADPTLFAAACRFDLEDGAAHVTATIKVPFWSLSVYDRSGTNLYSLSDRSAADGILDLVVLTPEQMIDVRKDLPEEFARSVLVELPIGEGIVVVRALAPDDSWKPAVSDFLSKIGCAPD